MDVLGEDCVFWSGIKLKISLFFFGICAHIVMGSLPRMLCGYLSPTSWLGSRLRFLWLFSFRRLPGKALSKASLAFFASSLLLAVMHLVFDSIFWIKKMSGSEEALNSYCGSSSEWENMTTLAIRHILIATGGLFMMYHCYVMASYRALLLSLPAVLLLLGISINLYVMIGILNPGVYPLSQTIQRLSDSNCFHAAQSLIMTAFLLNAKYSVSLEERRFHQQYGFSTAKELALTSGFVFTMALLMFSLVRLFSNDIRMLYIAQSTLCPSIAMSITFMIRHTAVEEYAVEIDGLYIDEPCSPTI